MPSLLRAAVFLAGSLAAGSWVGLGTPGTAAEGRVIAERVAEAAREKVEARADGSPPTASHAAGAASPPAASHAAAGATTPRPSHADARGLGPPAPPAPRDDGEFGPTPQERDPEVAGSPSPWPRLNPDASLTKAWMVAEGPQYSAESGRRVVTLTFDDGPFPETTPSVLKLLARHKVHATFFVIGRYLDGDDRRTRATRRTLERIVAGGHLVGNHTYDHARLTSVTHTQVLEQIDRGAFAIERVTGKKPILFRPPYGELDDFGREAVRERGLDLLLWSVEKQDMTRDDPHAMFRELASQLEYKGGGIVLLHDVRRTSVRALDELLAWLRDHRWDPKRPEKIGYDVVDLPTYLREVAAAPLPFASRDELERARAAGATFAAPPSHASGVSRAPPSSRAAAASSEDTPSPAAPAPDTAPTLAEADAKAASPANTHRAARRRSTRR